MTRPIPASRASRRERTSWPLPPLPSAVAIVAVGFAVLVAASITPPDRSAFDASLPNPMGGLARTAPGEVSGDVQLAGLMIDGAEVAMGDIALGVTYVPGWEVSNPTDHDVAFSAGQPRSSRAAAPVSSMSMASCPTWTSGSRSRREGRYSCSSRCRCTAAWTARTTSPSHCSPTASKRPCT